MKGRTVHISFAEYIRVPRDLYHSIGFNINYPRKNASKSKARLFFFWFSVVNMLFLFLVELQVFMNDTASTQDVTTAFPILVFTISGYWKFGALYKHMSLLTSLLERMEIPFKKCARDYQKSSYHHYKKEVSIVVLLMKSMADFTKIVFLLLPLIVSLIGWLRSNHFKYLLPLPIGFDVEQMGIFAFALLYCNQVVAINLMSVALIAGDLILYLLTTALSMYFENICNSLKMLKPGKRLEQLEEIVYLHEDVLWMSSTLNEIFSSSIWWNIASTCLTFCIYTYQIVSGVSLAQSIPIASVIAYEIQHVGIVCFLGNRLIDSSQSVSVAAYDNCLFTNDPKCHRIMLRIIQRAQRPAIFVAPPVSAVSMLTFQKVTSLSFRLFTFLNSSQK